MGNSATYEGDFHAWAFEQAELLRAGRFAEADTANLVEEIESMGRSQRSELISRMAVLMTHLLKWTAQPNFRGRSWTLTIAEQRRQLARHLRINPSLRSHLDAATEDAFGDALVAAQKETGLDQSAFPATCPWAPVDVLRPDFLPE